MTISCLQRNLQTKYFILLLNVHFSLINNIVGVSFGLFSQQRWIYMFSVDVFPRRDYRPQLGKGDRPQESGGNKAYVCVYLF